MRRAAWMLLLVYVFAVPWEYSLDLGPPFGNIARVVGIAMLLATIPAVANEGSIRRPGALQWTALGLSLWVCCSFFWTIDQAVTLEKIRGAFQEMMVVWVAWEFAENQSDFRAMVRAMVGGCWVLAALTVWSAMTPGSGEQVRFAAVGQDPNDVARYLDLGFPLAAFLIHDDRRRLSRLVAIGYIPVGLTGVLLTASRGGFVAALVGLAGCSVVLWRRYRTAVVGVLWGLPLLAGAIWVAIPEIILRRLETIPQQLSGGDLNKRFNIWSAGWKAFNQAPICGHGAGSFVSAAGLSPIDTAHNTALSILVETGVVGLTLASAVLVADAVAAWRSRGATKDALVTALLVWMVSSMVGTTAESRTTWVLFALTALAGRLAVEDHLRRRRSAERAALTSGCDAGPGTVEVAL